MATRSALASLPARLRPTSTAAAAGRWRRLLSDEPTKGTKAETEKNSVKDQLERSRKEMKELKDQLEKAKVENQFLKNQIHKVARYYSTFSVSCPAAKTRSPTTGMPSIIAHPMKPSFVDSVRGPKRTFSSKIIKHNIDWEAERAKMEADLEASKKISSSANWEAQSADVRADFERCKAFLENLTYSANADLAAWRDEMDKDDAKFDRLLNGILCGLAALGAYGIYLVNCGLEYRRQSLVAARANVENQNP